MIVMGLHFGHDASICIIRDGEILICLEVERLIKVKHAISISAKDIELCLTDVNLSIDDIDYCGLTSTQMVEYVLIDPDALSITLDFHPLHTLPCTMTNRLNISPVQMEEMSSGQLYKNLLSYDHHYKKFFESGFNFDIPNKNFFGSFEHFIQSRIWETCLSLKEIALTSYEAFIKNEDVSYGFHYPATLSILGKKIPSYIFSHHFAHAAYAFYESPYEEAAILTHDGGGAGGHYGCGFFAYGKGNRLYPLTPHHLAVGELYDYSAMRVGFDVTGGAGKLMGLAAYGKPKFYSSDFVGNWYDIHQKSANDWIAHCEQKARELNYDTASFGNVTQILDKVNVDFAASSQKIVEESMIQGVFSLKEAVNNSVGHVPNLCLSGGVALNCPANTRIASEGPFDSVSVLPAVIDSGLSIGSALAIYYNMAHKQRLPKASSPLQGFFGMRASNQDELINSTLNSYKESVNFQIVEDGAKDAALSLNHNFVIAWFYGRSEIGPRALGHRSILANPKIAGNWKKVNGIKKRELWRPFAPAVIAEEAHHYFDNLDFPSYFMLFNAQVRSQDIPAVTHFDGSARVQSVTQDCGPFYDLIKEFWGLSGIPVVLNTSFNGPGQPVIESPSEAIEFLLSSDLDYLYFGNVKVWKR